MEWNIYFVNAHVKIFWKYTHMVLFFTFEMPVVTRKCIYEDDNINTANASVNKIIFELEKYCINVSMNLLSVMLRF